ncbi:MAG: glycoside hydrolase domain-containing protein [bacterium]
MLLLVGGLVVAGGLGLAVAVRSSGPDTGGRAVAETTSAPASATTPGSVASTSPGSASPSLTGSTSSSPRPARPPLLTPDGHWWGVDSSGPITSAALANVQGWYRGATPQFWGRYVSGDYGVSRAELAFARSRGIYVYLIVNDQNCSQCDGIDICGHDLTAAQARADAREAIRAAEQVGVGRGAVLYKDIEQISSCRKEPSAEYLLAWYHTLRETDWRTGFYGNVYQQNYDFPRAYCAAVARDPQFTADVVLDMNQPEPRLGAPRGTTGPHNAPRFRPTVPSCAPRTATKIWQYGESIDPDNYTDIDQAVPDAPGMLAPDGAITGT